MTRTPDRIPTARILPFRLAALPGLALLAACTTPTPGRPALPPEIAVLEQFDADSTERLDTCVRWVYRFQDSSLREQMLLAEQTLLQTGALSAPTREGYLALADAIDTREATWDGFCAALSDRRYVCSQLVTGTGMATYPYCLRVLAQGPYVVGPWPLPLREMVATRSDSQFRNPSFRAAVVASALWTLSEAD